MKHNSSVQSHATNFRTKFCANAHINSQSFLEFLNLGFKLYQIK